VLSDGTSWTNWLSFTQPQIIQISVIQPRTGVKFEVEMVVTRMELLAAAHRLETDPSSIVKTVG
jgi:hypothetical protein